MDIVTMLNQKGGVGKTSTTHHLAGSLARQGRRVLLVDDDPQSSLSQGFWGPSRALSLDPAETIHAVHRGDEPYPELVIRPTGIDGIDLLPGSEASGTLNARDPQSLDEEEWGLLKSFLAEVDGDYDLCLIDCPPNLYYCSWAALVASRGLVVPMQPEDYGAQGIAAVRRSIAAVQAGPNPGLRPLGYVLTMVRKNKIHQHYEEALRTAYGPLIFQAMVPEAVAYVEAISNRLPIASYRPKGAPAKAIDALAAELLARLESDPSSIPLPFPTLEPRVAEEVA